VGERFLFVKNNGRRGAGGMKMGGWALGNRERKVRENGSRKGITRCTGRQPDVNGEDRA